MILYRDTVPYKSVRYANSPSLFQAILINSKFMAWHKLNMDPHYGATLHTSMFTARIRLWRSLDCEAIWWRI